MGLEEPGASYNVALPAFIHDAAAALTRLQERVAELEEKLRNIRVESDRPGSRPVHMRRVILLNTKGDQ